MAYCIKCGTALAEEHRFCFSCGAARYEVPGSDQPSGSAPAAGSSVPSPSALSPIARARTAALFKEVGPHLALVQFLCAAGAVFWAILLTQTVAVIAAPAGRAGIEEVLLKSGVDPALRTTALIVYSVLLISFCLIPIALHAFAYYALRAQRRSGWVVAVLLAGAWSFVLIGIPFLYLLMRRDVRRAFGFLES